MKVFTAKDIALLGDPDPEYGQTYFGTVHEQFHPVRFNLKKQVDIQEGRKFTAEETDERTSGKGNKYTQLKKVKLSEGAPVQPETPDWIPDNEQIQEVSTPKVKTFTPEEDEPEAPAYERGTNARWAIGMAYRAYERVMGTPEDAGGDFPFEVVKLHAQNLVQMFDELVYGKEKDDGGE